MGYTEMLTEARQIATKRMVDEAEALGADAIINIRVRLFFRNAGRRGSHCLWHGGAVL